MSDEAGNRVLGDAGVNCEGFDFGGGNQAEKVARETQENGSEGESEWAVVKEPVTPNTLIETALAQFGSLSLLANVAGPSTPDFIEDLSKIAKSLVTQKLPAYIALLPTSVPQDPKDAEAAFLSVSADAASFHASRTSQGSNPQATAKAEADLAVAVFTFSIAGCMYESGMLDTATYSTHVTNAFQSLERTASSYPESAHVQIFSAFADALIDFADNVVEMEKKREEADAPKYRWIALETAQAQLTQATNKLSATDASPGSPSKAKLYYTRANVDLLRWRLTQLPSASKALKQSEAVLLKNAGMYYRGAAGLAKQESSVELWKDAEFRGNIARALEEGKNGNLSATSHDYFSGVQGGHFEEGIDEMIEEGLVGDEVKMGLQQYWAPLRTVS